MAKLPIQGRRPALIALLALGLLAAGDGQARSAAGDPGPLRQEVSLGPVRLTLEADRRIMPIDGQLHLSLVVEAPGGTAVTLPAVADKLGPFLVASRTKPAVSSNGGGLERWRSAYVLEAEGTGDLTLPPLTVAFRAAADGAPRQLATAPLRVTMTSLLPADPDLTEYKDIAPPVELPPAALARLLWPAALLALGLGSLALLLWRRRRRFRPTPPSSPAAHLLALAELDRLGQRLPADRPGTEDFYVRLADILRRYVASRFGLSAPAQTTEELLAAAEQAGGPVAARRPLIGRVLSQCDLVKFARRQPASNTAAGSLRQARDFVEQTAEPQVAGPPAATAA